MASIKAAFLLWLLVTSGLETADASRLNSEEVHKIKQRLGVDKAGSDDKTKQAEAEGLRQAPQDKEAKKETRTKEEATDSMEEVEKEAQGEEVAADSAEGKAKKEAKADTATNTPATPQDAATNKTATPQNSRPTVGDMVIVLDTDVTRRLCSGSIGNRGSILADDKSDTPYRIVDDEKDMQKRINMGASYLLNLREEDVRLIADHATLEGLTSAKSFASFASSKSLTSKMKWGLAADAKFSDATILAADGHIFSVHRAVLAAASPVFQAAFSGQMTEAANKQINISDAPAEVVEAMLAYIYSGELDASRALAVLPFAHRFDVTDLADVCIAEMLRSVNSTNILATVYAFRPLVHALPSAEAALRKVAHLQLAVNDADQQFELLLNL